MAPARCQACIDLVTDALANAPAEDLCQPTIEISDIKPETTDRTLAMSVVRLAKNERTATMTARNIKKNLFKPSRSTKENRAAMTDRAARLILDSEAAKRQEKIEKLRNQRLAMGKQEGK
jgi:flagellar biosynthesis/type III secretory pathway protein FliH